MASIYDSIKTAAELVSYVSVHGFSTKDEDICRAQDIFGHSTIGELVDLANDIGRSNENGEHDPNGSWGNGRKGTRDTFYWIAFKIWSWEDAVRFWNMHTNPEHERLKIVREDNKDKEKKIAYLHKEIDKEQEKRRFETETALDADRKVRHLEAELHARDMTIMELKAELYDLMKAMEQIKVGKQNDNRENA